MADEVIRVTCPNTDCEYHGTVHEYNENYRQHSIHLCGNCGGELHEISEVEWHESQALHPKPIPLDKFRRVKSNNPLHPANHPQIKGLTKKERAAGWEIHPMLGKIEPEV